MKAEWMGEAFSYDSQITSRDEYKVKTIDASIALSLYADYLDVKGYWPKRTPCEF